jgi:nucleolar GTP-binding protein
MTFERLPTHPTSEELIDKAFSRAARAGRAKSGLDAQQSMLQTASNILADNLENLVREWPDFDRTDPFYYELADALVDVDACRQSLSELSWASRKCQEIRSEYQDRLRGDTDTARKFRKQAFARLADVIEEVEGDLASLADARNVLRELPEIDSDEPTIVVAGYPNVGKSTFVNSVTNARNETARYPFTTKQVHVGHIEENYIRYQLVDTPGLLDRAPEERNEIESQALSALTHLADTVLVFVDASGACGYPLSSQLALRDAVLEAFDVPVLTVCTKADRSRAAEADLYMSVAESENVEKVLETAIDAVGYEPELPYEG